MSEILTIVKVGGNVIEDTRQMERFVDLFSRINGKKILIHGGGRSATTVAETLGVKTEMVEGRRITGDEMLDVVVMVYGGLINKKMVALLSKTGSRAVGLTGADGDLLRAQKRPAQNGMDYGWVGDIKQVNCDFLDSVLKMEMIPIICSLTHDGKGQLLNTNADTIASEIAISLASRYEITLNYCFELQGVLRDIADPGSLIKNMTLDSFQKLKNDGNISEGMIPKLHNAFQAIQKGVQKVNILDMDSLAMLNDPNYHEYTTLS